MKKLIIIPLCLLCLFGCAYNKRVKQLEKRVDLLEMRAEDHEDLIKVSHELTEAEKSRELRMMRHSRKLCQPSWRDK